MFIIINDALFPFLLLNVSNSPPPPLPCYHMHKPLSKCILHHFISLLFIYQFEPFQQGLGLLVGRIYLFFLHQNKFKSKMTLVISKVKYTQIARLRRHYSKPDKPCWCMTALITNGKFVHLCSFIKFLLLFTFALKDIVVHDPSNV